MPETNTQINLKDKINQHIKEEKPFFSLEFFPPRSESNLPNFCDMLKELKKGVPLFWDITWNTSRKLKDDSSVSSMAIAIKARKSFDHETVLHMTCVGSDEESLMKRLNLAKESNITNILALRGDKVPTENGSNESNGKTISKFNHAVDLVRFIRQNFGNYFTIIVAGYPDGHPETSYEQDLKYLKEKVDAGADLIITQLSFSFETYSKFIDDCRKIGISIPIIPGIFAIQSTKSLSNILCLTQVKPPEEIEKAVNNLMNTGGDQAVLDYGIELATDLCRRLLDCKRVPGLHFYTMNREESVVKILKNLNLWQIEAIVSKKADKTEIEADHGVTKDVCIEVTKESAQVKEKTSNEVETHKKAIFAKKPKKKSSILTAEPLISQSPDSKETIDLENKQIPSDKV